MTAKSTSDRNETKSKDETYRILSLDGGGIRGLITAVWLYRLEQELKLEPGLNKPITEHFNLIAGTSTGSVLACGLASGMKPIELVKLYKEYSQEIFTPYSPLPKKLRSIFGPLYSDKGLEKVLKDKFRGKKFCDLKNLELTTFVTSYDTFGRRAICFNSDQNRYKEVPVWEICKASSSAPTFFPAHILTMKNENCENKVEYEIPLIDGGVVASNPTACALAEAMKERRDLKTDQFVVVSLGTGDANYSIPTKKVTKGGLLDWARNGNFINVFFDGSSQAMDHIASKILNSKYYYRFQAKLEKDSLDDVSDRNIKDLLAFANCQFETDQFQKNIQGLKCILKCTPKAKKNDSVELPSSIDMCDIFLNDDKSDQCSDCAIATQN